MNESTREPFEVPRTETWGKKTPRHGVTPAIALLNPKYPHNVGMAVRLASCYGIDQVWFTGDRVSLAPGRVRRLPREERMKGYRNVDIIHYESLFDQFRKDTVPVAVEVRANAEPLHTFEHPTKALYVFGPEDGNVPAVALRHCYRFVVIPTRHCLNLATAIATVLWDRHYKSWLAGHEAEIIDPGIHEARGFAEAPDDLVFRE